MSLSARIRSSTDKEELTWKIGIVGEVGCGKSSLLLRFTDDEYSENPNATIGAEFKLKVVTIKDKTVSLQLYDTQGQERFRSLTASYYRGAHGIVVAYDVTNRDSFDKLTEWLHNVRFSSKISRIIMVGNKIDLKDRQVSKETALRLAEKENVTYLEASAKDGTGVKELFAKLGDMIEEHLFSEFQENTVIELEQDSSTKKKCCCSI